MKIKVSYRLADMVDELCKNGTLVLDDGATSKRLAYALSPLRKKGHLVIGLDRRLGKSILLINGVKKRRRRNRALFGTKSIFEFDLF